MIRVALCAFNARYTHTNLAVRSLAAYAGVWFRHKRLLKYNWLYKLPGKLTRHINLSGKRSSEFLTIPKVSLIWREWTINDHLLALLQQLDCENADVYAFSLYIWNSALVRTLTVELKKIRPCSVIIWGGPEASTRARQIMEHEPAVDYVLCGEGEAALTELLAALTGQLRPDPGTLACLPGLAWRSDDCGDVVINANAPLLGGDDWPFAYSDTDLQRDRDRVLYYESSRGCPFNCSYCLSSLDRTVRFRSLDKVQDELDRFIAAGVRQVKLVDRTFNCQPDRAARIWKYLIERYRSMPYRTNFHFEIAGDLLDDEALEILQTAPPGLLQFEIGVQSANPAVLQTVNRKCDLARLASQVGKLRKAGNIHIHLDLIAGLPGETSALFGQSFDFVNQLRPHQLQLGFLKVLPGTQIRKTAQELGYLWMDDAPYEVLQSDAMSFADLCRLKQIELLLDYYPNSSQYRADAWLCRQWPEPWAYYNKLADDFAASGLFDQALGPEERLRHLYDFAVDSDRLTDCQVQMFLDLMRTDFMFSGQKSLPEWLSFWELSQDRQDKIILRDLRLQAERAGNRQKRQKLRFDRIRFSWALYCKTGELTKAVWLMVYDCSEGRPVLVGHGPFADGLPVRPDGDA
ncbi:MAG: DUF4080 domain-containing protein [Bacillota bacterium]|nr:DUF4080 domain-containing protein [Bacillota bacterium]